MPAELELPKVYFRGPAPKIILNDDVCSLVGSIDFSKPQSEIAFFVLNDLHNVKGMSQREMGEIFGVQGDTIRRWMKRVGVKIRNQYDVVSSVLTKHKKMSFSGDESEKAYLEGLRHGDVTAQKHGRNIRVSVGTSHPALLSLFESVFGKYSNVRCYPHYNSEMRCWMWSTYCDLDSSFGFLLKKHESLHKRLLRNKRLFFEFVSGYFDADGCLSLYAGKSKTAAFILKSCDKQILDDIHRKMGEIGINVNSTLAKKADGIKYMHDFWYVGTGIKRQVFDILSMMGIKHAEKISKKNLLYELESSDWKDAKGKIACLRKSIKLDVRNCIESARLNAMIRKYCN